MIEYLADDREHSTFAWRYLKRLVNLEEVTLRGDRPGEATGHIFAVTFLDDNLIMAGDEIGHVRLWHHSTGELVDELPSHGSCVNTIRLSPDGQYIVTSSCDETIHIYNRDDRTIYKVLRPECGAVAGAEYLGDGSTLVSYDMKYVASIWDVENERVIETIGADDTSLIRTAIDQSGDLVVTAHKDGTVRWCRRSDPTTMKSSGLPSEPRSLAIDHTGTQIAISDNLGHFWIWHPDDNSPGEPVQTPQTVRAFAFSPDNSMLATGGRDFTVRLWNIGDRQLLRTFQGHVRMVNDLSFSPSGDDLASASDDYSARIWRIGGAADYVEIETSQEETSSASLSPDGKFVVLGRADGSVVMRTIERSEPSTETVLSGARGAPFTTSHFSADGRTFMMKWQDGLTRAWDLAEAEPKLVWDRNDFPVIGADAASGLIVRNGEPPHDLVVQQLDGTPTGQQLDVGGWILSWAFSKDARMMVIGTSEGSLIWDLATGDSRQLTGWTHGWPEKTVFSSNGRLVAVAAGWDVGVWNAENLELVAMLRGHTATVRSLAFSPDGRLLATGSDDTTVRLWHVETAQEMLTLEGHHHEVSDVAFNGTGDKLYSVSSDDRRQHSILCWPTAD